MQPLTGAPRNALTAAAVTTLIRDAPSTRFGFGCELLDRSLSVVADITPYVQGGSVTRTSYADLHGSATLAIGTDLDWGSAIMRPYMTVTSPQTTARFNLGAYFASTPRTTYGMRPVVHEVDGIDVLDALRTPVGESYAVAAGVVYLVAIETILVALGYPAGAYAIDQTSASAVLPTARTWVLDDNTTWLTIVNDLLSSIGYMGVWSDWDGRLRVQQYATPVNRQPEWVYDTGLTTSMLSLHREVERDMYSIPNRWVFYRSNVVEGEAPVAGNGIYTVTNENGGTSSVEARGRVITRVVPLDVADQAALIASGQRIVDADQRVESKVTLSTWPNPLHWHFDRVEVRDPDLGPTAQALVTKWTLPFDGKKMSHEWSLL